MKQIEYSGEKSILNLTKILKRQRARKVLLVTGRRSYENSKTKLIVSKLLKGYVVHRYADFSVNPEMKDIEKGIAFCRKEKFDLVVAVGGGSVMDTAKVLASLSQQSGKPKEYISNKKTIEKPGIPLVAVPTTSGSGSEATKYAAINIGKTKHSIDSYAILPKYAILDPELTYDLPPEVTAVSGIDALCQAVESYWAVNATAESKRYAKKAAKIALQHLSNAVNAPTKTNRAKMSKAANLAGKAICISRTTACHAISYPITSFFNIPHGHAVALTFSSMLLFNSKASARDCNDARGIKYVRQTMAEVLDIFQVATVPLAQKRIHSLLSSIHLEQRLSKVGIQKKDFNIIISNGFTPLRVKNNPRLLTKAALRDTLNSIY